MRAPFLEARHDTRQTELVSHTHAYSRRHTQAHILRPAYIDRFINLYVYTHKHTHNLQYQDDDKRLSSVRAQKIAEQANRLYLTLSLSLNSSFPALLYSTSEKLACMYMCLVFTRAGMYVYVSCIYLDI